MSISSQHYSSRVISRPKTEKKEMQYIDRTDLNEGKSMAVLNIHIFSSLFNVSV